MSDYQLKPLRSNSGQGLNLSAWNNFISESTRQLPGAGSAIKAAEYGFYTQGNSTPAGANLRVLASMYRMLRDTDNVMRPKHSANTPMWQEAA